MADLDERLKAREALEASFESLQAQGIQASLNYIQVNVAPQLANLKTSIDLAQAQIDQIIIGGKAPDTLKFGGQLPAYYATAQALSQGLAEKVPTTRKVNGKDLAGDITLDKADVGLSNANNTSDKDKPVSDAQRAAIDAVAQAAADADSTKASNENRHLNPAFQVSQDRNVGTLLDISTPSVYLFDGVVVGARGGGILRGTLAAKTSSDGSVTRPRLVVQTADAALAATDFYAAEFPIEGVNVSDLQFGTAGAKPFTWRGVVCLPQGTYGLSFTNFDNTRTYVAMFTVTAGEANKDKLISFAVPGDTAGTWLKDTSGTGIRARVTFAFGSSFMTATEGAWVAGNFLGTAAQTNALATVGNTLEIADIGLYFGTKLPEWQKPDYDKVLKACRRLFRVCGANVFSTGHGSYGGAIANFDLTEMRGSPVVQAFSQNNFGGFPGGAQTGLNTGNSQKRAYVAPNGQAPADSGAELILIANSRL
ncbi:hypothetical protein FHW77_001968 [Agrobacterium sp. RC10-4-1]|uniref:hypothetical protein n=1 Tax=Agrobacterium sp. RC10-4-1 TaxID=2587039 RepID=UPI0015FA8E7E|nr:hypothetical protein [Agrobacterium sp. RC10-4-1]MBA8798262.1 hypothetical protein [Agrobacterium sp. RC10-4-1]